MDDPVLLAATNNVLQSEAVLAALGSPGSFTDDFWSNDHTFDVPYANGATLGSAESTAIHYAAIEHLTISRPSNARTHIMDSWATLDLARLGFRVRIADEWFMRDSPVDSIAGTSTHDVERIRTARELAEFEAASAVSFGGVAPERPGHTYPASLLSDARFAFFGLRIERELAAGVFLFEDERCTGIFTFFTLPAHRQRGLGSVVLQSALNHAPSRPVATNPSSMSRGIFEQLGFHSIGERRIWESQDSDQSA